jgi:hypothetical protein
MFSGRWRMARTRTSSGNWRTIRLNTTAWWRRIPAHFQKGAGLPQRDGSGVFEQARLTGEPVKQMTLPGVDGQELQFQIVKSENNSSRQGMFSGHLAGNNDSLVTLAFADGREAFTVLSPKENIFIVGEPREDGQVIVKAIDPNTYGVGPAEQEMTLSKLNRPINNSNS